MGDGTKLCAEPLGVSVDVDVSDEARGKGKEKTLFANADEPGVYDALEGGDGA